MSKYGACPSRRVYQAFDFSRSSARITTVRNPWNIVRLLATASLSCGPTLRRNIAPRRSVHAGGRHFRRGEPVRHGGMAAADRRPALAVDAASGGERRLVGSPVLSL